MRLAKVKRVVSSTLGELPLVAGGHSFRPSSYKRETKDAEVHENFGYLETPQAAELKIKLQAIMDVSEFKDISDDSVTIYLDDGNQHMMPRAWVVDAVELGDGEMSVTYNSGKSEKL
ncbi:phage tail tube protein [Sediminispirochaeta bajacaliforniensis]|uniref:phage tail tube protein n=1 Tax=Sediminispirochaeta bajacaliforniensis TaxID=148 RepID=UPI0003747701|nr:phage tail tube protein [Sediminispirochaeta bajacaliforniensis]